MKIAIAGALLLAAVAASAAEWKYDREVDKMTGKTNFEAYMVSDNKLDLKFPYQGENYGQLSVRQKPGEGTNVLLTIAKGQIMCHTYECTIRVKFDDAQPVTFSGDHPSDRSARAVFLSNPQRFIARAKTAKKLLIEFTAYNQGTQLLEFGVPAALSWPPK